MLKFKGMVGELFGEISGIVEYAGNETGVEEYFLNSLAPAEIYDQLVDFLEEREYSIWNDCIKKYNAIFSFWLGNKDAYSGSRVRIEIADGGEKEIPIGVPNNTDSERKWNEAKKQKKLMGRFLDAISAKDNYTLYHSHRVENLSLLILDKFASDKGKKLSLAKRDLGLAARFHDIGKIAIPDSILLSPRNYHEETDDDDRRKENGISLKVIHRHPLVGAIMMQPFPYMRKEEIINGILFHHERYKDASSGDRQEGYYGTSGAKKLDFAWIIGIADAFDAMVSKRPYKDNPRSILAAREIIRGGMDMQFCREYAELFLSLPESDIKACLVPREHFPHIF